MGEIVSGQAGVQISREKYLHWHWEMDWDQLMEV
jgi:hypothetical protein